MRHWLYRVVESSDGWQLVTPSGNVLEPPGRYSYDDLERQAGHLNDLYRQVLSAIDTDTALFIGMTLFGHTPPTL